MLGALEIKVLQNDVNEIFKSQQPNIRTDTSHTFKRLI